VETLPAQLVQQVSSDWADQSIQNALASALRGSTAPKPRMSALHAPRVNFSLAQAETRAPVVLLVSTNLTVVKKLAYSAKRVFSKTLLVRRVANIAALASIKQQ
jgi:hypothetical protein